MLRSPRLRLPQEEQHCLEIQAFSGCLVSF